jgi:hypothetical protein
MSEIPMQKEMEEGPQVFYQMETEQIRSKVIILGDKDLSETIQFLKDKIIELQSRVNLLETTANDLTNKLNI